MVIAEIHSNLDHSGVVILWMVNGCNGLNLMAYRRPGQSIRRHIGWAGILRQSQKLLKVSSGSLSILLSLTSLVEGR